MHLQQECTKVYRVIAMELSNFAHRNLVAFFLQTPLFGFPFVLILYCFNEAISPEEKTLVVLKQGVTKTLI